jgi:hypothetical protein
LSRTQRLIEQTDNILWIKYVSMFVILNRNGLLFQRLGNLHGLVAHIKRIKDVRFLVIDLESDQAKQRSYREYLMNGLPSHVSYDEFIEMKRDARGNIFSLYEGEKLYADTRSSLIQAKNIADMVKIDDNKENKLFAVGMYKSSPDSAILITDHAALFEPLHYGVQYSENENNKVYQPSGNDQKTDSNTVQMPILSGEMPLFEFKYTSINKELKGTNKNQHKIRAGAYQMMRSNFEFVYDNYSTIVDYVD